MVKKKVGGGKRYKAAISAKEQGSEPKWTGPAPPKHLQRKIARKVGFLDKVAATAPKTSLSAKPVISKAPRSKDRKKKTSKALASLSSLAGLLDEVERKEQQAKEQSDHKKHTFGESVRSSKARHAIEEKETARLQQVLHHPVFKSNPIQAIANHLKASLPPPPTPAAAPGAKGGQGKGKKQPKKQGGGGGMMVD